MSISYAKGRPRLEVTSRIDRVAMVSYKCAIHVLGLLRTVLKFHAILIWSQKNGR
jgi:hypothetical protein